MKAEFVDDAGQVLMSLDHIELLELERPEHRTILTAICGLCVDRALGAEEVATRRARAARQVEAWDRASMWPTSQPAGGRPPAPSPLEPCATWPTRGRGPGPLAISADGRTLAALFQSGLLEVWDLRTGACRRTLELPPEAQHMALALAPDGGRCAVGGTGGYLAVWDLGAGSELHQLRGPEVVYTPAVAFSDDGERLLALSSGVSEAFGWEDADEAVPVEAGSDAAATDSAALEESMDGFHDPATGRFRRAVFHAHSWCPRTGKLLAHAEREHGWGGAFQADGAWSVQFRGPDVAVHRGGNAAPVAFHAHLGAVTAAAASPEGARVLTGDGEGAVWLWDAATGRACLRLQGPGAVRGLALGEGARRVAVGFADGTVLMAELDPAGGAATRRAVGRRGPVTALAMTRDGRTAVTGDGEGQLRVWSPLSGGSAGPLQ